MPLLRGRRDEAHDRYRMQEKLFAIGDDFWIENEAGQRVFKVDGKVRVRDTLVLETPNGEELFSIQTKVLHVRDTMTIERGGRKVASVKKALVSPLATASPLTSTAATTWRRRATSSTTSTRSSATGTR